MSFPRYPKYKDNGVAWLGEVPEEWAVKPLRGVGYERQESNTGLIEDNLLSLSYGKIIRKNIDTLEGLLPESFETYQIVHPDDIVFRLTDLQNDKRSLRTAIVRERGIITFAYVALAPQQIEPRYLSYLLRDYDLRKVFYSMGGGVRQSMKYEDIRLLPLVVPSVKEQVRISDFLNQETAKIDALIEEQRRLIELLKEKRQAVISHAFTSRVRAGTARWNVNVVSGTEWKPTHLKRLTVRISKGTTPTTVGAEFTVSGVRFIKAENIRPTGVSETPEFFIAEETHELLRRSSLEASDVLVVIAGATTGKSAVMTPDLLPANTNQAVSFVRLKDERYAAFVNLWLSMKTVQDWILLSSVQSAQPNLSMEDLGNISIAMPPADQLDAFLRTLDARLDTLTCLSDSATRATNLLQERRSALISAAVTGKIDVRNYKSQPAAVTEEMYEPA